LGGGDKPQYGGIVINQLVQKTLLSTHLHLVGPS
jgi:hypothetical protein